MFQVVKRDGKTTAFDISKISQAIKKAFDAQTKQYNDDIIDLIPLILRARSTTGLLRSRTFRTASSAF